MGKSETAESSAGNATSRESKPNKVLPTNRVAFVKQMEIVRAFGASGGDRKLVPNVDVAKIVNLHASTVGLATPFLSDAGLVVKGVPCEEVVDFAGAFEWNAASAFHRVAPILKKSWFFSKLEPKLRFRPMNRAEAIQELSIACGAGPSYRANLEMLLQFLHEAGLIVMDGDNVKLARSNGASSFSHPEEGEKQMPKQEAGAEPPLRASVATSFSGQAAGVVQFNISVKVDAADFAVWEPSRITAFFAGVAQVLAAKGGIEEKVAKN